MASIDVSNALRNLGRPLTKMGSAPAALPIHTVTNFGQMKEPEQTHARRSDIDPHAPNRFSSEVYPIAAAAVADTRSLRQLTGHASRSDGREFIVTR